MQCILCPDSMSVENLKVILHTAFITSPHVSRTKHCIGTNLASKYLVLYLNIRVYFFGHVYRTGGNLTSNIFIYRNGMSIIGSSLLCMLLINKRKVE